MANIMNLKSIRNKTSRNGFDLSFKKNFSAKVGELLPIMCKEVLPGDSFTIDVKALSRTKPLNTAAFARIREYYDFYFVPYNLLWNKSDTVLTQMLDNPQHSNGLLSTTNSSLDGKVPHITMNSIAEYINSMQNQAGNDLNYFGFRRAFASVKLLEYLGYGNYSNSLIEASIGVTNPVTNLNLNIFGLLAYQKIYADHFRDSQWEKSDPSTFNVDWIKGTNDTQITLSNVTDANFWAHYNMFDLRYANWQKDLFHGIVPNAQYGNESVYPLSSYRLINLNSSSNDQSSNIRVPLIGYGYSGDAFPVSELSILKLRQYEFLQKWKEVAQVANKDYKDQIKQHWDVNVGDYSSELSQYLGGTSNTIDINEVVNTNITDGNPADIAGKGYGVSNGLIRFDSNGRYGLLMCIYHAVPLIDYTTDIVNTAFTKVNNTDYAIPEFDKVGMQPIPLAWLNNPLQGADGIIWDGNSSDVLGYAPRYIDYKTSVDESVGSFKRSDSSWVIGFSNIDLFNQYRGEVTLSSPDINQPDGVDSKIDYTFFKVSPSVVNDIFAVNAGDSFDSDQLLNSAFFDVKAVRNLDVDGLPY